MRNVRKKYDDGGIVKGKSHADGGEHFVVNGSGQHVELEGREAVISAKAFTDDKVYTYKGTNWDILNQINKKYGGNSLYEEVESIGVGDFVICIASTEDETKREYTGTNEQVISAINESGGCVSMTKGAKVKEILDERRSKKMAGGGKIDDGLVGFGQPIKDWAQIAFIHETSSDKADSIIKDGFILKAKNNTNGVYTIPSPLKKDKFNPNHVELAIWLKPKSKILWTNTQSPSDFYVGYGNKYYQKIYKQLNKNWEHTVQNQGDFLGSEEQATFCRNLEKWLNKNGYCGVQQGGEIVITDLDCIDDIYIVDEEESEFKEGGSVEFKHDETYKKWRHLVNMSYSELKSFYDSEEGKEAGLTASEAKSQGIGSGRQSARWIMKMKRTPKGKWTDEMWRWAGRQVSFISRMSGNEGPLYDEKGRKTRKHLSLLIWGHDPKKKMAGGQAKYHLGGDMSKHLAPNGKPSNLTPEQYKLVRTPQFKAWFGDWENDPANASKVVDENGEPLVCNHSSTQENIDIFYGGRIFRTKKNQVKPIWFTYKKFNEYASGDDIFQYQCFLKIKNLFDYSKIEDVRILKKSYIEKNGEMLPDYDFDMDWDAQEQFNLPAYIYELGYNGYKFTDEYSIAVFNPEQIKLADGSNTTFDGSNPDIRYKQGGRNFKTGGRTLAQTPAPKSDRVYGSSKNKPESASSAKSGADIKLDDSTIAKIETIIAEYNEKHPSKKITLSVAKAVVRRGMGAYSSSHRPTISGGRPNSRVAWGLARLKAFVYKAKSGSSKSGKYSQDNDLLTELGIKHSKYEMGGDIIKGGKADKMSFKDLAKHHGVSLPKLMKAYRKGLKHELEHTNSRKIAGEIAKDHIFERLDYYDMLDKAEKTYREGGINQKDVFTWNEIDDMYPYREGYEMMQTQLQESLPRTITIQKKTGERLPNGRYIYEDRPTAVFIETAKDSGLWMRKETSGRDRLLAKGGNINWSEYYAQGGQVGFPPKKFLDKEGNRKVDENTLHELTEYVSNLPQTKTKYFNEKTGQYTPERRKLHAEIINSYKDDLVCIERDHPIAILMGGSPASGKSSFLKKYAPYLLKEEIFKIDADDIRSKLPEYEGWNATQTHLETKDIVNTIISDRNIGIPCNFDLIYDGTMNSTKSYEPLIDLLKKRGYRVYIVYMDNVAKDVVEKRAIERYRKSGRFVPLEVIDDFFSKGKTAFNALKEKVDGYMVVDGSTQDYRIIDKGGMNLPTDRAYGMLGRKIEQSSIPELYARGGALGKTMKLTYVGNESTTEKTNKFLSKWGVSWWDVYRLYSFKAAENLMNQPALLLALNELNIQDAYDDFVVIWAEMTPPSKLWKSKDKFIVPERNEGLNVNMLFGRFETTPKRGTKYNPDKFDDVLEVLSNVVSDDPFRKNLSGVYIDMENGKRQLVATNAHILAIIPFQTPSAISASAIIDPKTKKEINEKFPNYEAVIPNHSKKVNNLDVLDLLMVSEPVERVNKFFNKGSLSILLRMEVDGEFYYFDSEVINPLLIALGRLDIQKIDLGFGKPSQAVTIYARNTNRIVGLMMPVQSSDTDRLYVPFGRKYDSEESIPPATEESIPPATEMYGLKIGDVIPQDVIRAWVSSGDNWYLDDYDRWEKINGNTFSGDRKIILFDNKLGVGAIQVSGTSQGVRLRAEGLKEFWDKMIGISTPQAPAIGTPTKPQLTAKLTSMPYDSGFALDTPTGKPSKLSYSQQLIVRTDPFKKFFGDWESAAESFIADGHDNFTKHYDGVSKIIDIETLEPAVLYHGTMTDKEFFEFDVSKTKTTGRPYGYFAFNKEYSENFLTTSQTGKGNNPVMYEVFLNVRHPFIATGGAYRDMKGTSNWWLESIKNTISFDQTGSQQYDEQFNRMIDSQIKKYIEDIIGTNKGDFWMLMARDLKQVFKGFLLSHRFDGILYYENFSSNHDVNDPRQFTKAVAIFDATQVKLADGRNWTFDSTNTDMRMEDGGQLNSNDMNDNLHQNNNEHNIPKKSRFDMLRDKISGEYHTDDKPKILATGGEIEELEVENNDYKIYVENLINITQKDGNS